MVMELLARMVKLALKVSTVASSTVKFAATTMVGVLAASRLGKALASPLRES